MIQEHKLQKKKGFSLAKVHNKAVLGQVQVEKIWGY